LTSSTVDTVVCMSMISPLLMVTSDQGDNGRCYRSTSAASGWLRKAVGLAVKPYAPA